MYLIDIIFKKTIEYFKENPKSNIYILSIICNNIPCLNDKHAEFVSRYYNEMSLIIDTSNQKIIYNNFDHLYSFCKQLKINGTFITLLFIFYRKYREMVQFLILPLISLSFISATDIINNRFFSFELFYFYTLMIFFTLYIVGKFCFKMPNFTRVLTMSKISIFWIFLDVIIFILNMYIYIGPCCFLSFR